MFHESEDCVSRDIILSYQGVILRTPISKRISLSTPSFLQQFRVLFLRRQVRFVPNGVETGELYGFKKIRSKCSVLMPFDTFWYLTCQLTKHEQNPWRKFWFTQIRLLFVYNAEIFQIRTLYITPCCDKMITPGHKIFKLTKHTYIAKYQNQKNIKISRWVIQLLSPLWQIKDARKVHLMMIKFSSP